MMKSKLMLLLALLVFGVGMVSAQTKKITGKVIDEDGLPVIGAVVMVDGTQIGASTNNDGVYTILNAPADVARLRVRSIGMEARVVAYKEGQVIMLKNNAMLNEVMVVAFGTSTKQSFTGSATVLDSKDLVKHTTTSVANSLVGNVPGLQMRGGSGAPGSSGGAMNIRGLSSMYAGTEPLIIVDGAPYTQGLANINTEDIESVTVLKDAASAALYGARGANGVILVTTKKGKSREAEVSVDIKWGSNSRAIQDYDVIKDPGQYYEAYYGQLYNMYYYDRGMSAADANEAANIKMLNDLQYNVYGGYEGQLIGMDGKLNPQATLGRTITGPDGTQYYLTPDDWTKAAYGNALRQEYNVSIKGQTEKSNIYASVGYLNEDGMIEYSGYERFTGRLKADYQAKPWLKFGANVSYTRSTTHSNPNMDTSLGSTNIMYFTSDIAPIYPIYVRTLDENGNPVIKKSANGNDMYDYGQQTATYDGYGNLKRPFLASGNPLGSNRYNDSWNIQNQLHGTFNVDINLTHFLKFNATSNINWYNSGSSVLDNMLEGPKKGVNGEIGKAQVNHFRTNHVQTLTYFDQFGDHNINVMIGHEYYKTNVKSLSATGQGLFSNDIPEISAAANNQYSSSSTTSGYNVEGYFGQAQYNYQQKYFASASYRRDASSYFHPDNRWGDFWSAGAAWLVNKESFLENVSWIDMLKFKLSVGQQGNDGVGNWCYVDMYSLSRASTTQMTPSFWRLGNKDITWETTTSWNLGLEFNMLKNRVNGEINFYNKLTTDQLFWLSIPETMGSRGYYGNMGDVRNRGVELTLSVAPVRTKDVEWSIYGNIAHNANTITKLPESKMVDAENGYRGFTESGLWFEEGGSMYTAFRAKYAGMDENGKAMYWKDSSLGGKTDRPGKNYDEKTYNFNEATKYDCGSMMPKVFGGFGTSIDAYGFDLSVSFDYQIGGQIYDTHYASLMAPIETQVNGANFHKDVLKSWSPNNTSSNIPRFQYGDQYTAAASDRFLTSASYLNFQNFTVGYTLPKSLTQKIQVSKLRVYCSGENLCFWSARKGLDPRYSYSGNTQVNVYSPVRTVMGGVQVTF